MLYSQNDVTRIWHFSKEKASTLAAYLVYNDLLKSLVSIEEIMNKKKEDKINYQELAEQLAKENAELNNALLRERADAMNIRKRAEDEKR
jgi:molecular chaperone GrpE (heat shock protein)